MLGVAPVALPKGAAPSPEKEDASSTHPGKTRDSSFPVRVSAHVADFDLLVIGDCNPDLIMHGGAVEPVFGQAERLVERACLTIGGSAAITACGAARLGLRTALVAVLGDDPLGRLTRELVDARGVDTSWCIVEERPTGVSVVLSKGVDRAILTAPGTVAALRSDAVPIELIATSRHVHVSSYFLQPALWAGLPNLLVAARAGGATTSLDPNWDPSERWDGGLGRALAAVDYFLPNEEEVQRIAGAMKGSSEEWPSPGTAAADIAGRTGATVGVKLGQHGALLGESQAEAEEIRAPAFPVAEGLLDTTGAGDSFDAGFLAGVLAGWPLAEAVRFACVCGALSTRALGGTDAQPTMQEALAAMGAGS